MSETQVGREAFLLRTVDGPNPGTRVVNDEGSSIVVPWPLPDEIAAEGGRYVKTSESQLPPQKPDSRIMRGAEYHWQQDIAEE